MEIIVSFGTYMLAMILLIGVFNVSDMIAWFFALCISISITYVVHKYLMKRIGEE